MSVLRLTTLAAFSVPAWLTGRGPKHRSFRSLALALVSGVGFSVLASLPLLAQANRSTPTAPTAAKPANPVGSGLVTIESDRQQADNSTGVITAIGNVRITYPERGMVATARQAQYFTREGRLILSGDVDVVDGDGQRLRAEQIVYHLDGQRLVAMPARGQQVQTQLRLQGRPGAAPPRPLLP